MRQPMPKKILLTIIILVALIGLFGGCNNNENDIYQPASIEHVDASGSFDQDGYTDYNTNHNITIINTSFDEVVINPSALSLEEAANIGARYILDIFGESIDGMYMDLEFSDWDHMTRAMWSGAVTVNNRNTLDSRNELNELNQQLMDRNNAGEDIEDIFDDMAELFANHTYVLARFYFHIDAITGKRIDIRQTTPEMLNQPVAEPNALENFIEREWDGDWSAAFEADIDPHEIEEFNQLALLYAQKHFIETTVTDIEFSDVHATFLYIGGGNYDQGVSVSFSATDETGRVAFVTFDKTSRVLVSISTISNDFIPIEMEGNWEQRPREEEGYNDTEEGRVPPEGEED